MGSSNILFGGLYAPEIVVFGVSWDDTGAKTETSSSSSSSWSCLTWVPEIERARL